MKNLFDPESLPMRVLGRVADLMLINLLFLLCSLPVFTLGASLSAFYAVSFKLLEEEEGHVCKRYLSAFRENLRQATVLWLMALVAALILVVDLAIYRLYASSFSRIILLLLYLVLLIYAMTFSYLFPLQGRFRNPIRQTLRNAFLLSFLHFPVTALVVPVTFAPLLILYFRSDLFLRLLPLILFLFLPLLIYINSKFFLPVFSKYSNNNPQ